MGRGKGGRREPKRKIKKRGKQEKQGDRADNQQEPGEGIYDEAP